MKPLLIKDHFIIMNVCPNRLHYKTFCCGWFAVVRGDPFKLLLQYLQDKGTRVFDLYRILPKDSDNCVSRQAFISGLKVSTLKLQLKFKSLSMYFDTK